MTDKTNWVLVPRKPTTAMLEAICKRRGIDPYAKERDALDILLVSAMADTIKDYTAMVEAAQNDR